MSFESGDHLRLGALTTTVHVGAHADAPSHYHMEGVSIEHRDVRLYMGPAQVVEVNVRRGERVYPKDVHEKIQVPRVLFKTKSFPDPENWNNDFNSLSPELIEWLKEQKVKLVGIDTPSVDPWDSKELESHKALYRADFAVLEGIVLDEVSAGLYSLIALPLKIENGDASPVRAVLLPAQALVEVL